MSGCPSDCLSRCPADVSCCEDWNSYNKYTQCRALVMAWDTMRLLSGGRVLNCPVSMRPCVTNRCSPCENWWKGSDYWLPRTDEGYWISNGICGNHADCCCNPLCEILFPGEVASICEVLVDGFRLDPSGYRLDNHNRLTRLDGECWPSCQDLSKEPNEPNTMEIVYMPGIKPDTAALFAVGQLACEYAKACTSVRCRLPSGIVNIVRQGISMQLNTEQFPGGLTGILEVDSYISSINPFHHVMPPKVWSPDLASAAHYYPSR